MSVGVCVCVCVCVCLRLCVPLCPSVDTRLCVRLCVDEFACVRVFVHVRDESRSEQIEVRASCDAALQALAWPTAIYSRVSVAGDSSVCVCVCVCGQPVSLSVISQAPSHIYVSVMP